MEDKRFEAALRLLVLQIQADLDNHNESTTAAVDNQIRCAVEVADKLLAALRKEK